MVNPHAGEVALVINGEPRKMKLTLGALAELEELLEAQSLIDLVERFETGGYTSRDVLLLLVAGLRGGGWAGTVRDLSQADIEGGAAAAARAAGTLLVRGFAGTGTR